MNELKLEQMAVIAGGCDSALYKTWFVSCALAGATGWVGVAVFGPTCVGTAIGILAAC